MLHLIIFCFVIANENEEEEDKEVCEECGGKINTLSTISGDSIIQLYSSTPSLKKPDGKLQNGCITRQTVNYKTDFIFFQKRKERNVNYSRV